MKRYIIIICAALALASCTKKFEEMNQDPFSPTGTTIEALFNGVVGSLQQSMNEQFYLQNEIWYPETELGALTSESWGICVLIMVLTTKLMSQSDHLFSSTIYKRYSKGWHEAEVVTSSSILEHKSQIAMRSQTGPAALGAEGWRG